MENITLANIYNIFIILTSIMTSIGTLYKLFQKLLKQELEPFNRRIDETIQNNNKRFDELERIVDFNDIDTVRSRIVAFDNLCRLDTTHKQIKRHQYDTIFKDIDKWAMYHLKYPELNGEINVAIENIKASFKKAKFK